MIRGALSATMTGGLSPAAQAPAFPRLVDSSGNGPGQVGTPARTMRVAGRPPRGRVKSSNATCRREPEDCRDQELSAVRKSSGWSTASGRTEMPVWRYLLVVGGALLALLFAADAMLPRPPTEEIHASGSQLPKIRIYSERRRPEAVVVDTSRPTIVPDVTATADAPAAAAVLGSPNPGIRESFARLLPPAPKQADAAQPKTRRTPSHPGRKVVTGRYKHPLRHATQHSAFGSLESGW